ncbi:MAG: PEP-CTERM sorting domain-containing protein [Verrucomicrobiales bacterium]
MKHPLLPLILSLPLVSSASGALSLTSLFSPADASFAGFTAPATWATTSPGTGQLDSNRWAMNADGSLVDTPAAFGVDQTSGQGSSTGSESAAGVYAFEVGAAETALGVQPTGSFWSPGMFTLRLQNDTGTTVTSLQIDWTVWVYNDQGRSNDMSLLHSSDNFAYSHAGPEFDVLSPAEASSAPVPWQGTTRSAVLSSLALPNGETYFLRWGGDDVGGSGSRDELALGSIRVTPIPEPANLGLLAMATTALLNRRRRP